MSFENPSPKEFIGIIEQLLLSTQERCKLALLRMPYKGKATDRENEAFVFVDDIRMDSKIHTDWIRKLKKRLY